MASSSSSVSGLVSGLDTTSLISSLMQLEAKPQTILKTKVSTESTNIGSLQSLNAKLAALATKAADLAKTGRWSPVSTTSSATGVTATAGAGAVPGTISFTVGETAGAHQLTFAATAAGSDVVTTGSTDVLLTQADGSSVTLDTGDGTLDGLVNAVNSAGAGVSASAVRLDDGSYRLRVVSSSTGAASAFTLTNTDGSDLLSGASVTAGRDAAITVGTDTIHSATNTFTGLTSGVTVTIAEGTPVGTAATVTVSRDAAAASAAAKGLVDDANAILTQIGSLTAYNAGSKTSGPLASDPTVRALRTAVLETVTRAADGTTMAAVGIQTDRYGAIVFDAATFASAYAADPGAVAAKLGAASDAAVPGFAARLKAVATAASDANSGSLTTSITSRQSRVTTMQDRIADWDVRLATKQSALNRQYAALEVSLGKLNNQSSWLSGQINALSSSS
ncbi:MAG: flagellar filament capping protein FliD [Nocardioidaceae bacterium]